MAFSHETRLQIVIITVMVMVIGAVATESAVAVQASLGDDGGTGISIDERSGVDGDTTSIVAALKADAAIMLREGDAPICGRLSSENTIRTLLDGQMAQRAHAALCSTSALVQTQNAESGHDARVELRDGTSSVEELGEWLLANLKSEFTKMVDELIADTDFHRKPSIEGDGTHKQMMKQLPPLPDVEHLESPNDAIRALIHFAEATVEGARQHGNDNPNGIFAESALRLVANLLRSKKLAVLVETLKKQLSSGGSNINPFLMMPMGALSSGGASAGLHRHHRRKKRGDCTQSSRWGVVTVVLLGIAGGLLFWLYQIHRNYITIAHKYPDSLDILRAKKHYYLAAPVLVIFIIIFLVIATRTGYLCWYYMRWAVSMGLAYHHFIAAVRPDAGE